MPKMLIDVEEAKQVLLEHFRKGNPDVTEIVIEGFVALSEVNKVLASEAGKVTQITSLPAPVLNQIDVLKDVSTDVFDRPGELIEKLSPPAVTPVDPKMVALVRGLQTVSDDGRNLHIKYHKGENRGFDFELTKGLEERCVWCGYIAMSDKDLNLHKNTYHKDAMAREKAIERAQLDKAKADKQERLEELPADKKGWIQKK